MSQDIFRTRMFCQRIPQKKSFISLTLESPINAIPRHNFRFIPPDKVQAILFAFSLRPSFTNKFSTSRSLWSDPFN
jgi:hypothetical protein